jgi:membrane protein YqaA with SNARE-associated domain
MKVQFTGGYAVCGVASMGDGGQLWWRMRIAGMQRRRQMGRRPDEVTTEALASLLIMLASAFGAATLLPFSSEIVLATQLKAGFAAPTALLIIATVGNVAGSVFNWWIGLHARRFEGRRWFPFAPATIEAASGRFQRWGVWSLLLAWTPVIGDPLTFIAGVLRVPFWQFLPLVAIGKGARYAILVASL